jgi:hypothetical protein
MQLQLAHATNESSYKYGFQGGKSEWQSCAHTDGEGDCTAAGDFCASPYAVYNTTSPHGIELYGHTPQVTNITACIHGYVYAWNNICNPVTAKKQDIMSCPLTRNDIAISNVLSN